MSTKIFYFTGTGNSLVLARNLSDLLGDSELISIPQVINDNDLDDYYFDNTSDVGLIFPVYMWGIPNMVLKFLEKLQVENESNKPYIFAVATCAGQPGETLLQLQKLLQNKGMELDAGFTVLEASNTIQKDNIFIKMAMLLEKEGITLSGQERLSEIVSVIKNRQKHPAETSSRLLNRYGKMIYGMAMPRINTMGQFFVDDNCNQCLNCQKICPSNNISLENEKPVWGENCEFCQACIQWCPREAIHIKNEDLKRRYHNPDIKIKDLILR